MLCCGVGRLCGCAVRLGACQVFRSSSGVLQLSFSRALDTGSPSDRQVSLAEPAHLIWAYSNSANQIAVHNAAGTFSASFTSCPSQCSGHGTCLGTTCGCDAGWMFPDCATAFPSSKTVRWHYFFLAYVFWLLFVVCDVSKVGVLWCCFRARSQAHCFVRR